MKVTYSAAVLLVSMGLTLAGCSDSEKDAKRSAFCASMADKVGKHCIVQFRRDTLGAQAPLPISPNVGSINGAEVIAEGKLLKAGDHWIVIADKSDQELYIPEAVILLVCVSGS